MAANPHRSRTVASVLSLAFVVAMAASQLRAERARRAENAGGGVTPVRLRCEYLANPLGIDVPAPRLSWVLAGQQSGRPRPKANGLPSARGLERRTAGPGPGQTFGIAARWFPTPRSRWNTPESRLRSRTRCHWKVRVWDRDGRVSAWSTPAVWEMALLEPADWKAKWIDDGKAQPKRDAEFFQNDPAPLLRKEFLVDKPVRKARLVRHRLGLLLCPAQRRRRGRPRARSGLDQLLPNACSTAPTT